MKITSGFNFEGYYITDYVGFYSGEVVLGTGFLSEFSTNVADFLGINSERFAAKLDEARQHSMQRLTDKVQKKGGNAIIGLDIDYVTFSGNIIGVIANGTAVKISAENEKEENILMLIRTIPVANYSTSQKIRPCSIELYHKGDHVHFQLIVKKYDDGIHPTHLHGDLKLHSNMEDLFDINNNTFELTEMDNGFYRTDLVQTDYTMDHVKLLTYATVKIERYLENGVLYDLPTNNEIISAEPATLNPIKNTYGYDAIQEPNVSKETWNCCCGHENKIGISCTFCGRKQQSAKRFDASVFLAEANMLTSAKEILECFVSHDFPQDIAPVAELNASLEKTAEIERLYGNVKKDAIHAIEMVLKEING